MSIADRRVNLVLAGAARSGTTALATALDQHPDIFVSVPKEVHFFAHAQQPTVYRGPGDDTMLNRPLITDPAKFDRLFQATAAKVRAEGSVSTLAYPERSIAAIKEFADPNAIVVAMLREPAARARSSYQYLRARGYEDLDTFAAGLDAESARTDAGFHHMWRYRALSRYEHQLPAFSEAFGQRFLVGVFEEERSDLRPFLRRICAAVGVDPSFEFAAEHQVNRGGEPRSRLIASTIRRVSDTPLAAAAVKRVVPPKVRERLRSSNLRQASVDEHLMDDLRQEFRPAVAAAESVLGRSIPSWAPATGPIR